MNQNQIRLILKESKNPIILVCPSNVVQCKVVKFVLVFVFHFSVT